MNVSIIMGRMTADPELRKTDNDISVVNFTVAVRNRQKDADPNYINCVAWRGAAELIEKYFEKGSPIAVKGYLQQRSYEDKEGNKRSRTEIVVDDVYFPPTTSAKAE